MPDHSDTFKVVQRTTHFKAAFSMAVEQAIADIALTTRRSERKDAHPGLGDKLGSPVKMLLAPIPTSGDSPWHFHVAESCRFRPPMPSIDPLAKNPQRV
jgi:hypothetical protein